MRISSGYQFERIRSRTEQTSQAFFEAQNRVSTGKRINRLSDDANGFATIISMRSLTAGIEQYAKNLSRAKTTLNISENALNEVNTLITRANALAVSGGTATASVEQRRAMAVEVETIRDRVLQMGNTKGPNGEFIFAGTASTTQPFVVAPTGISFRGNAASVNVESAPGQQVSMSLTNAGTLFTTLYNDLDNLKKALETGDTSQINGTALTSIQDQLKVINNARADIGVRVNTIDSIQADHTRRREELTKNVSDIEDVDLSQAIMDYKSAETAYQASLQIAGQGFRLSLLDYIRG